jgi:hypothetical protein
MAVSQAHAGRQRHRERQRDFVSHTDRDLLMYCHATPCRDKVCIDQSDIARALRCLPVFVFSCKRLLILAGNTYYDRLWCVW